MSNPSADAVVHRLADVLNSDNVARGLADILAPVVLYNGQQLCTDSVAGILGPLRRAVPDLYWHLDVVVTQDRWAATLWTVTGTHQVDFLHPVLGRAPATGTAIRMAYTLFCRIEGGRIVETRTVSDRLTLFQQLRALPVLGIEEEAAAVATA